MKGKLKDKINELLGLEPKLMGTMKIHVKNEFYTAIPWDTSCTVNTPTKKDADSLIDFIVTLQRNASNNPIITGIQIIRDE